MVCDLFIAEYKKTEENRTNESWRTKINLLTARDIGEPLFNYSDVDRVFQMGLIDNEELSYKILLSE